MLQRDADGLDLRHDNPFVPSTSSVRVQTFVKPPPQAYRAPASRHTPNPISQHYQLLQDDESPTSDPPPSKIGSLSPHIPSSGRRGSRNNPSQSEEIYQDKSRSRGSRSTRSPQRSVQDLEKACQDGRSMRSSPSSNQVSHHPTIIYEEEEEDDRDDPKNHAVWILVYLSAFNAFVTIAIAIYSLFASAIVLAVTPLRFCTAQPSISAQLSRFLVPPLRYQLGIMYSQHQIDDPPPRGSFMLVLVNFLAPVMAVGVCVAAWVAGGFWLFAKILGNPNANSDKEEEKNDGKATVMWVKDQWVAWLLRGLR